MVNSRNTTYNVFNGLAGIIKNGNKEIEGGSVRLFIYRAC